MDVKEINDFKNYGDSTLEEGAVFLRKTGTGEYIEVYKVHSFDLENYHISYSSIDPSISWDWDDMNAIYGTDYSDDNKNYYWKAFDLLDYYGVSEFGDFILRDASLEEARDFLQKKGVIE